MNLPEIVHITEVGMRDGLQIEPEFVPTSKKIELINGLIAAGLPQIEYSSFVSPKAVPQLVDAKDVLSGVDRIAGTRFSALVPNARGAERAAEAGVDQMVVFVSASPSHNKKNVNRTVDESLKGFEDVARIAADAGISVSGAVSTAFGCPFEGNVASQQVVDIARQFQTLGFTYVSLGDTTGMATPPLVESVCTHLQKEVPDLPITLHFHNTRGIGLVNVMAGLRLGIDRYESSIAGLGGCPFAAGATGNICTEDLVNMLDECGVKSGVDLDRLCDVARNMEGVIGRTLPGQVMKAGPRSRLHPLDDVATATG